MCGCALYFDAEHIGQGDFFYAQEAGILRCFDANESGRLSLDSFLIVFVMSGKGCFFYDGKKYTAHAGSCFLIDCTTPYRHECTSDDPWEIIWLHFYGGLSRPYYDHFVKISPPLFYSQSCYRIGEIMKEVLIKMHEKKQNFEADISLLITELLTKVITTCQQKELYASPFPNTSVDDSMSEIIRYIDHCYQEKITLDSLSERFSISKYYLSRRFKEKYGEGLNSYVNKIRLNRAKELLRFSENAIVEVAQKSGFQDVSYFNKCFRRVEGISPTEYRNQWREL